MRRMWEHRRDLAEMAKRWRMCTCKDSEPKSGKLYQHHNLQKAYLLTLKVETLVSEH